MPSTKRVILVHDDLPDQPITVSPRAAKVHALAGWKEPSKTKLAEIEKAEKAEQPKS